MEVTDSPWHTLTAQETVRRQNTSLDSGLSDQEARQRLDRLGPNRLREEKRETVWHEYLEELRQPMVLLLLVTGIFCAVWGEPADALIIFFIILTLNSIEVYNERRAGKAVAALRKLAEPTATVRRDGCTVEVAAEEIVPGDLPLFKLGFSSNRVMVGWGAAALAFVLAAILLRSLYPILKTTLLTGTQWALIVAAVVTGSFWIEARKLIAYKGNSHGRPHRVVSREAAGSN